MVEARQHYESGLARYNLKEYKAAIEEFEAAYRLKPDPVFLYNLGQAYRLADDPEQALHFYRAYLRERPNAANRKDVEERVGQLEEVIAAKKTAAQPPDHTLPPETTP
ncbi:MAG: tetratricopeptide repeat protein, partial [Polyangia bacterium]